MVKISNELALKLLENRLNMMLPIWGDIEDFNLYSDMYKNHIEEGVFESVEFDPMVIVDNDIVNYTKIITGTDSDFEKILSIYKKEGLTDVSCEELKDASYSFIEAVDDEENPSKFLMRY